MLAEISFYNFVLFLHIAAVVLAFGVTFTYPVVFAIAHKGFERNLPFFHHIQAKLGERMIAPLGGVVLPAGLYLALEGPYDFSDPWSARPCSSCWWSSASAAASWARGRRA